MVSQTAKLIVENEVWAKCRHLSIPLEQPEQRSLDSEPTECTLNTVEAPNWLTHAQKQKVWPYKLLEPGYRHT